MQQLINFIVELIHRWVSPTPKFFKTLRTISVILGVIASIAPILSMFDVQLNLGISLVIQKVVAVAAFISAIVSQLTQENPVKSMAHMPYTVTAETEEAKNK